MSAATGSGLDKLFAKVAIPRMHPWTHLALIHLFLQIKEAGVEFQEMYLPELER